MIGWNGEDFDKESLLSEALEAQEIIRDSDECTNKYLYDLVYIISWDWFYDW
jgi:hypothetical protein